MLKHGMFRCCVILVLCSFTTSRQCWVWNKAICTPLFSSIPAVTDNVYIPIYKYIYQYTRISSVLKQQTVTTGSQLWLCGLSVYVMWLQFCTSLSWLWTVSLFPQSQRNISFSFPCLSLAKSLPPTTTSDSRIGKRYLPVIATLCWETAQPWDLGETKYNVQIVRFSKFTFA